MAASVLAAVVVTSLVGPGGAQAQPKGAVGAGSGSAAPAGPVSDEKRKEAAERFKRGVQLQADGNLDAAVIEFERAYELAPAYQVLFNIAVVYRDKNDRASALRAFERFLSEGGAKIDAKKRKDVETEISKLKDVVATITVKVNVAGAEILLDDYPIGKSPLAQSIMVNVGRHKIEASKEGYKSDSQLFALAGRDDRSVELTLKEIKKDAPFVAPPPTTTTPPPATTTAPPPATTKVSTDGGSAKGLGYGLTIAGVLGVGLGGYFGLSANSAWKDAKDLKCDNGKCPTKAAQDKAESAKSDANLSTLGFGLGGAALIAGVVLLLTSGGGTEEKAASQQKIRVAPSVGQREGGVVLGGSF